MQYSKNTMETVQEEKSSSDGDLSQHRDAEETSTGADTNLFHEVEQGQEDLAQLTDEELETLQGAGARLDNIKLVARLTAGGVFSTIGRVLRTMKK